MYIIIHSLAPFGWEKNGLAEHNDIKAGSIKMHQIYYFLLVALHFVQTCTLQTLKDSVPGNEYTTQSFDYF